MANYVNNLIILHGKNISMAKLAAGSQTSIFDFEKIMPAPVGLPEFTSPGILTALANHIFELDLDLVEVETLLSPVESYIAVSDVFNLKNEYKKKLEELYSPDGYLNDKDLGDQYPATREEYEQLGQRIYNLLKNHNAITLYDWRSQNWHTRSEAEGISSAGKKIRFYTRSSSPFPVIQKWVKDNQLSLTYKVFESGCHWWYVAEFSKGELISKRDSDKSDLRPLLKQVCGYTDKEIEEYYTLN